MPDLKSELMKLSNLSFDDPGEPDMPATITPITERQIIWNYIKDHPKVSCSEIATGLKLDVASSASQVGALLNRSLVKREHEGGVYRYEVCADVYPFFDRSAHARKLGQSIRPNRGKPKAAKAKPVAVKAPTQAASPSVKYILDTMPIGQARSLYDELKKIFGN